MIKFNDYLGFKIYDHCYLESIDGVEAIRYGREKFTVYAICEDGIWKTSLNYKDEEPEWVEAKAVSELWLSLEERDSDLAVEENPTDFFEEMDYESKSLNLVDDDVYAGYESDSRHDLCGYFNL